MKNTTNIKTTKNTNNELLQLILSNATESTALKASRIKEKFPQYCKTVESLRIVASSYATQIIDNTMTDAKKEQFTNDFFTIYKKILKQLAFCGKPLKAQSNDFEAVIAIVGTYRKDRELGIRAFLPTSKNAFRNNFEKFVAHRINGELSKDAATIEAERKSKNARKREARKAAEKAAKKA